MDRRRFTASMVGAVLCAPLAAEAQQAGKIYRIGFLWEGPAVFPDAIEAFRQGLRDLGYVEGRNIAIEYRWAEGKPDRMREFAEDLVRLKVDIIMAPSSVYTGAAKRATSAIPIIFMSHADPIRSGHVAPRAARRQRHRAHHHDDRDERQRPGTVQGGGSGPQARCRRLGPATPSHGPGLKAVEGAGPSLGLRIQPVAVRSATEFDAAFSAISREHAGGVLVLSTPLFIAGARRLAELALTHKLPSLFGPRHHVEAGGLMSYSPDRADLYRRGAIYVDKILKGAKPAELPVQQAEKFELVINVKTAKAIGLAIPQSVLARADHIIE
jgi:putative ABC transport system substrate-binding protein